MQVTFTSFLNTHTKQVTDEQIVCSKKEKRQKKCSGSKIPRRSPVKLSYKTFSESNLICWYPAEQLEEEEGEEDPNEGNGGWLPHRAGS